MQENYTSEALAYFNESLEIGQTLKHNTLIKNALENIYTYYESTNNHKKAITYLKEFHAISDSIVAEQNNQNFSELQLRNEIERREKNLATMEEEVSKLQEELEGKEVMLNKSEQRKKLFGILSVILLLVIIGLLIRKSKKQ
jgi:tetratricopeptide (TPR) repeat protein